MNLSQSEHERNVKFFQGKAEAGTPATCSMGEVISAPRVQFSLVDTPSLQKCKNSIANSS